MAGHTQDPGWGGTREWARAHHVPAWPLQHSVRQPAVPRQPPGLTKPPLGASHGPHGSEPRPAHAASPWAVGRGDVRSKHKRLGTSIHGVEAFGRPPVPRGRGVSPCCGGCPPFPPTAALTGCWRRSSPSQALSPLCPAGRLPRQTAPGAGTARACSAGRGTVAGCWL